MDRLFRNTNLLFTVWIRQDKLFSVPLVAKFSKDLFYNKLIEALILEQTYSNRSEVYDTAHDELYRFLPGDTTRMIKGRLHSRVKNGVRQPAFVSHAGDMCWRHHGLCHRDELNSNGEPLPAQIWRDSNLDWYHNGKKHRLDGPASIQLLSNGLLQYTWWVHGLRHRDDDKPAFIMLSENNHILQEIWYTRNCIHRDNDKPALITYWLNGTPKSVQWYNNGSWFRENGPVMIEYADDGTIIKQRWTQNKMVIVIDYGIIQYFTNGRKHRTDGPAIIGYNISEYWLNGARVTKDDVSRYNEKKMKRYRNEDQM